MVEDCRGVNRRSSDCFGLNGDISSDMVHHLAIFHTYSTMHV